MALTLLFKGKPHRNESLRQEYSLINKLIKSLSYLQFHRITVPGVRATVLTGAVEGKAVGRNLLELRSENSDYSWPKEFAYKFDKLGSTLVVKD